MIEMLHLIRRQFGKGRAVRAFNPGNDLNEAIAPPIELRRSAPVAATPVTSTFVTPVTPYKG
jgi:hypothetical protein